MKRVRAIRQLHCTLEAVDFRRKRINLYLLHLKYIVHWRQSIFTDGESTFICCTCITLYTRGSRFSQIKNKCSCNVEILRLINIEHYFIFGPFLPILSFKDPNVQKMPFYLRSDFAMLKNFLGWFKKI